MLTYAELVAGCTSGVGVSVCTFVLVSKYVGTSKATCSCSVTFALRTSGQILLYDLTDAKASLAKRDTSSRWLYFTRTHVLAYYREA